MLWQFDPSTRRIIDGPHPFCALEKGASISVHNMKDVFVIPSSQSSTDLVCQLVITG